MNEKLTKYQLEEIRQRSEKATKGNWRATLDDPYYRTYVLGANNGGSTMIADIRGDADADFIAHARQDIPALLGHIALLNEVISNCRCAECGDELGEDWTADNGIAFCNCCAGGDEDDNV